MPASEAQRLAYRDKFRSLFYEEFQRWFEEVAKAIHGAGDFQPVRVTRGDGGLDGHVISLQLVYAVYAPARRDEDRDSETAAKIRRDFAKAWTTLKGSVRAWTFLHNHPTGKLGKLSHQAINELKARNPTVRVEVLNIDGLWELMKNVSSDKLDQLVGAVHDQNTVSKWAVRFVNGASCKVSTGIAGTLNKLNGHHQECFSTAATVILGTLDGAVMKRLKRTRASWVIKVPKEFYSRFVRGFVAVGCVRYYGGLHSRKYDSKGIIFINKRPLDRILLRIKPEGHSDYFCQLPKPDLLPSLHPFSECRVFYSWPLLREHLEEKDCQLIELEIDGYGNWDVDYVGLIYQMANGTL